MRCMGERPGISSSSSHQLKNRRRLENRTRRVAGFAPLSRRDARKPCTSSRSINAGSDGRPCFWSQSVNCRADSRWVRSVFWLTPCSPSSSSSKLAQSGPAGDRAAAWENVEHSRHITNVCRFALVIRRESGVPIRRWRGRTRNGGGPWFTQVEPPRRSRRTYHQPLNLWSGPRGPSHRPPGPPRRAQG
jgi:hypothetical protein